MVSPMASLVFSLFLTLSMCSANAITPSKPAETPTTDVQTVEVDPYMFGVCEGIASISMTVRDMQLQRSEKNLLVFSVTTVENHRQNFYCFQCLGEKPEDEIIVLSSVNNAQLACSEGLQ
jgi:hypothetical protein